MIGGRISIEKEEVDKCCQGYRNKTAMEVWIPLHQTYTAGELLWENANDFLRQNKYLIWMYKLYLPSLECCSTAKKK